MNNYKPTRKEVLKEMWNRIKENRPSDLEVKEYLKDFTNTSLAISVLPHIIPSVVREMAKTNPIKIISTAEYMGRLSGCIAGMFGLGFLTAGYEYLVRHNHAEALLIPITTNVVSGLCELGRYSYKNTERRLIEKHNQNPLENLVEDSNKTIKN